ncbi:hypothetical protein BJ508DRAFT_50031 [Ascobolus immersus RN42]|uniref:Uncharacterized protein n=1 Tax=Ascobolus immersus RN42 TaxID=1160509 RepID=A0A3N4HKJ5_ASCIM|nr:hypothetical protein BJ508DRAFT_50031 [Ascobolus immersus RN42]
MLSPFLLKRKEQRQRKLQRLGPLAELYGYTTKMPKTPRSAAAHRANRKRPSESESNKSDATFPPNKKPNIAGAVKAADGSGSGNETALLKELGFDKEVEIPPTARTEEELQSTIANDFAEFGSEEEKDGTDAEEETEETAEGDNGLKGPRVLKKTEEASEVESESGEENNKKVDVVDLSLVEDSDSEPEERPVKRTGSASRQTQLAGKGGRLSYAVPDSDDEEMEDEDRENWHWLADVLVGLAEKQARCLKALGPGVVAGILMHAADKLGQELGDNEREKKELEWKATVKRGERKTEVGEFRQIQKFEEC